MNVGQKNGGKFALFLLYKIQEKFGTNWNSSEKDAVAAEQELVAA